MMKYPGGRSAAAARFGREAYRMPCSVRSPCRRAEAGELSPSLDARRLALNMLGEADRAITEGTARGKLAIDKA